MNAGAPRRVLLIGGTSEIGLAVLRRLLEAGPVNAHLLGRDGDGLGRAATALTADGVSPAGITVVDAEDLDAHPAALARAFAEAGPIDLVIHAVGVLGGQAGLDSPREETLRVMHVNFTASGSLLVEALGKLREQERGTLMLLSSVAAERPRAANAVYGAAKAGLDALAQGLADGLAGSGVRVLVVRPGFVHTRMTADLPAAPMATTPAAVADAAVAALDGNAHTVWVPGRLRFVFGVLRHLPRFVYRRLPL